MQEDLLGYLLGALEPHEMRRVAQRLREDPEARRQLDEIERMLRPLEQAPEESEAPPPSDLVSRTLAAIGAEDTAGFEGDAKHPADGPTGPPELDAAAESAAPESAAPELSPMANAAATAGANHSTWFDWAAGVAALVAMLGILLPTVVQGRFEARKAVCQDQLRQFGTALTQYVSRNQMARLPAVAESGPEAFAGIYAVRLSDAGLLTQASIRWCPSLRLPIAHEAPLVSMDEVVSADELYEASVDRLQQIQRFVGGHYAYTLGFVEHDQLKSPRYESRASFAVMSDAPMEMLNGDGVTNGIGHGGVGINVLFEDGRVQFIPVPQLDALPDHPLRNHHGASEAGVHLDDSSLAPSWRPPFITVRQR